MKKGLIAASAECSVCKKAMRLMKRNSSDGYIWECHNRGANGHRTRRSVRKNSWFEESKLSMIEILKLTNMWVRKANRDFIAFERNVANKTVTDWMSFCREKYNRGKPVKGTWVFGGIERSTNKCFLHVVKDRSKDTLLASIKSNIKEGTTIISDCWKSYNCLEDEGFLHLSVNHKMYFKVPETGAHTNSIEGSWNPLNTAQRKHLDDFLRGRNIGRLECRRTQLEVSEELGIAQSVISRLWQRFQYNGNVSRCDSTRRPRVTTPNENRYIWQLLPKETDGAQHQTCLFSYRYDSFKADHVQTLRADWSICS
ncbi:putative transposase-like protein [Trichonephila clavipes]|nr:putative transposase-like protein [Trichonephila clavipes]